jgi:hypothetical protein
MLPMGLTRNTNLSTRTRVEPEQSAQKPNNFRPNNNRGRNNSRQGNNSRNNYQENRRSAPITPMVEFRPANTYQKVEDSKTVIFDYDEFYPLTLDLALFGMNLPDAIKVSSLADYERFKTDSKADLDYLFVISEDWLYFHKFDQTFVKNLKEQFKKSKTLLYKNEKQDEVDEAGFDFVALKSTRSPVKTLLQAMAEAYDINYKPDKQDPESD